MTRTYFAVKVKRIDGKKLHFKLPKDLQSAMAKHRNHGGDWKGILKGALVNIEMAPHTTNLQPPITTAMVLGVYVVDRKFKSTRSQFISHDSWDGSMSISQVYGYLHHDYSLLNRLEIRNDINFWKRSKSSKLIWLLTKLRTKIYYYKLKRARRK